MEKWITRISRAFLMGLAWAVAWMPIAIMIGTRIIDPDNSMDEMWFMVGALPGMLCGVAFSGLAGLATGSRTLVGLSLSVAAVRGVLSGILVGGLWVVGALLSDPPKWLLYVSVVGSLTLASAVSGIGSALTARLRTKGASANAA